MQKKETGFEVIETKPIKNNSSWDFLGRLPKWVQISLMIILIAGSAVLVFSVADTAYLHAKLEFGAGPIHQSVEVNPTEQTDQPGSTDQASVIPGVNIEAKTKIETNGNECAPTENVPEPNARDYIKRFAPVAVAEMHKFGVPASITLAQGLVESAAGTSWLARNCNNHFGIKCFSRKCPPGHCTNKTDDHHKDFFRKYPNTWGSFRSHSQHLKNGDRYAKCFTFGKDYRKWAYGLKAAGYATDRNYAEKLIGMVERYELYRYDQQ